MSVSLLLPSPQVCLHNCWLKQGHAQSHHCPRIPRFQARATVLVHEQSKFRKFVMQPPSIFMTPLKLPGWSYAISSHTHIWHPLQKGLLLSECFCFWISKGLLFWAGGWVGFRPITSQPRPQAAKPDMNTRSKMKAKTHLPARRGLKVTNLYWKFWPIKWLGDWVGPEGSDLTFYTIQD